MENVGHGAPLFSLFLTTLCSYFIGLVKANGALISAVSECWHSFTQAPRLLPREVVKGLHNCPSQILHSFCRVSQIQLGVENPSDCLLEWLSFQASTAVCAPPTMHLPSTSLTVQFLGKEGCMWIKVDVKTNF